MALSDTLADLKERIDAFVLATKQDLDAFKSQFTGKKGQLTALFKEMKTATPEERKTLGQALNELKTYAEAKWKAAQDELNRPKVEVPQDITLPGPNWPQGGRHPLSQVLDRIIDVFERVGFNVETGPEIETDWYNFTALNFPPDHPARQMQDTFFVANPAGQGEPYVLRTHTSPVQVRLMERQQPPIRSIMPGRVYRNEAVSARAHCFFHQVEALYVEEGVSFADLKQTLTYFAESLFGPDTNIRLRPSYFPFTEISVEMDITCLICGGEGCGVCKHTGWVEVLGGGMVDPNVFENCGIDPNRYSGFALGLGVERVAQLLFRIPDLRLYSQNDQRFLQQFHGMAL